MIALILAAGLGTRLRPWTLSHPKALVSVCGVPMLRRVIDTLAAQGFDTIIVNVHHFAQQIVDFVNNNDFGVRIIISDESDVLLDTGGAVVKAASLIDNEDVEPILVHNVDILSNADLNGLMRSALDDYSDISLLVSERNSSRKLIFDDDMVLRGWHNISTGEYRPPHAEALIQDSMLSDMPQFTELAFSGIYVIKPSAITRMRDLYGNAPFPVMDFFLNENSGVMLRGVADESLKLIDIGKPDTLEKANGLLMI